MSLCKAIKKNKEACKNSATYGSFCYWHQEKTKTPKVKKKTDQRETERKDLLERLKTLTEELEKLKISYNALKVHNANSINERIKLEYYVNSAKYSCPICLDEEIVASDIMIGYCGHTICIKCHDNSNNKTSHICSLCREPFYKIDINSQV